MCNGTHSKAGIASTINHVSDANNPSAAFPDQKSGENLCSEQSQSPPTDSAETLSGAMDTSPDAIQFVRLKVYESGLHIGPQNLGSKAFNEYFAPGTEVSLMLCNKTAVITTDPLKRSLLRSAEELQFRQDELKKDFSSGILHLIGAAT